MKPHSDGRHANSPLMINALMWPWLLLMLLLSITMSPTAAITASIPLELPAALHMQDYARSNYQDPDAEAFAGLAGYTRDYYGAATAAANRQPLDGSVGELAETPSAAPYANYEPETLSDIGSTASGFVQNYNTRLQSGYDGRHEDNIDFVINTANYEEQPAIYYQSYSYQPRVPEPPASPSSPQSHQSRQPVLRDYHIEQFSNYRHAIKSKEQRGGEDKMSLHHREANYDNDHVRAPGKHRASTLDVSMKRQPQQSREEQQDQQLLYSQSEGHVADLPDKGYTRNSLPPITTSVHHTATSSKAIAGLPLAKHIEVTKHLPITHYQRHHVPYKHTVQVRVPRPVIATIPKPVPIKVPVSRTVAVPQVQEIKIPVEKLKPVAVERPVPFVVERRVPYRVEKPVATPIYYPYPVKVPIVRTVVHKQRPHFVLPSPGIGSHGGWTGNHLLG